MAGPAMLHHCDAFVVRFRSTETTEMTKHKGNTWNAISSMGGTLGSLGTGSSTCGTQGDYHDTRLGTPVTTSETG